MIERSNINYIKTFTGRNFYPLNPIMEDIDIEDIAHALGMICRYGGHSPKFYSVAEHSVITSYCVPDEHRLSALLHDASEAYLMDIPRPIKTHLADYNQYEQNLMCILANHFKIPWPEPACVKEIDYDIVKYEIDYLWGYNKEPAKFVFNSWNPAEATARFLLRFYDLI